MTSKIEKHEIFTFCQIGRVGRFRPSESADLWVNQLFGVFQVLEHILFVLRHVAIFLWIVDLFERSKIHVLAEIYAMVEISAKILCGKKTYMPPLNLL